MDRKHASDFPQYLLNLFDRYVHGEISRRDFPERAQKFAVGGLTAASLFEMLKPNYAWAIQVPKKTIRGSRRSGSACRRHRATAPSKLIWCDRRMLRTRCPA